MWKVKWTSERASSGGSAALSCHCTRRIVFVYVPSISGTAAAGKKKTSVLMSSVFSVPFCTSGEFFQKVAVSVRKRSLTTSHSSFARASRCMPAFWPPTAGFWPIAKKPLMLPLYMSTNIGMCEWSPLLRGK